MPDDSSLGTVALGLKYARFAFRTLQTVGWRRSLANLASEIAFDLKYGTRTWLPQDLSRLETTAGSKSDGVQYQGTNPEIVRRLLAQLPADSRSAHFVDYGCGKGRGLLLGIEAGFKRLTGVEFAPQLAEQGRSNLARARRLPSVPTPAIEVMDAAEYLPPSGPLVAFLYNPFRGETLQRVVQNLTRHATPSRTPVWVIYVNPQELECFLRMGWRIAHEMAEKKVVLGVILTPPLKEPPEPPLGRMSAAGHYPL